MLRRRTPSATLAPVLCVASLAAACAEPPPPVFPTALPVVPPGSGASAAPAADGSSTTRVAPPPAASKPPPPAPEILPPGAVEEPCRQVLDSGQSPALVAVHEAPTLTLAELAQVRVLGRMRPSPMVPAGADRYLAVYPVFIGAGKIAVRCDVSLRGTAWNGAHSIGVAVTLPDVTSVIFFLPTPAR